MRVLASALVAVVILVGGSWLLNNTTPGLHVKCQVFRDVGACFVLALTEPASPDRGGTVQPAATETPEEREARQAAEDQARRDLAVLDAATAISRADGDVVSNAGDLASASADMTSAVSDVRGSLSDMQGSYGDLKTETQVRPMDDLEQDQVCLALDQVGLSRDQVDPSVEQLTLAEDPYKSSLSDRAGYIAAVQSASAQLESAMGANPTSVVPEYTIADANAALSSAAATAKSAATEAAKAKGDVASLAKAADALLSKARKLAGTVASC